MTVDGNDRLMVTGTGTASISITNGFDQEFAICLRTAPSGTLFTIGQPLVIRVLQTLTEVTAVGASTPAAGTYNVGICVNNSLGLNAGRTNGTILVIG